MDSDFEAKRVQSFIKKGNFHAAFNIAISALNACRRERDQNGVDRFLGLIKAIVQKMEAEFGSK